MSFRPVLPVAVLVVLGVVAVAWVAWSRPEGAGPGRFVRHVGLVSLGLLLLARPSSTSETERQTATRDVDIVFAVDLTTSMVAEDFDGDRPRLDGVRSDIADLIDDLAGARFSLVTFGTDAVVEVPFTTDRTAVESVAGTLRAEPYFLARGSSVTRPVPVLADLLATADDAAEERARLVVVFSDGETVGDDPDDDGYDEVADLVDGGVVLGYGTAEGGRMREGTIDIDEQGDYVRDQRGDVAVSRIDEAALRDVAADLDVEYVHRTSPGGLEGVVDPGAVTVETTGEDTTAHTDLSWLPASGLGALVLAEMWELTTTGQRTRRWWSR